MASATSIAANRYLIKALLLGFVITIFSYLIAFVCFAAQLHTAVSVLLWPSFVLTQVLPDTGLVTSGSLSSAWLPIADFTLALLVYSAASFYWLRHRHISAGA